MGEQERIVAIKEGLKKNIYKEIENLEIERTTQIESTAHLANILDGYIEKIDTMDVRNVSELEQGLKKLKETEVEVKVEHETEILQQYNDYIHKAVEVEISKTLSDQNLDFDVEGLAGEIKIEVESKDNIASEDVQNEPEVINQEELKDDQIIGEQIKIKKSEPKVSNEQLDEILEIKDVDPQFSTQNLENLIEEEEKKSRKYSAMDYFLMIFLLVNTIIIIVLFTRIFL